MNITLPDNLDVQALFADSDIDFNDPAIFPKERTPEYKDWQERRRTELAASAERARIYRKEHKEQCAEAVKKWCAEHPEQVKDIKRRYRETHKDKEKEYRVRNAERKAKRDKEYSQRPEVRERHKEINKKYYNLHRGELKAKAAEYRATHRDEIRERHRAWYLRKKAAQAEQQSATDKEQCKD